jgi:hypothetical protein
MEVIYNQKKREQQEKKLKQQTPDNPKWNETLWIHSAYLNSKSHILDKWRRDDYRRSIH